MVGGLGVIDYSLLVGLDKVQGEGGRLCLGYVSAIYGPVCTACLPACLAVSPSPFFSATLPCDIHKP